MRIFLSAAVFVETVLIYFFIRSVKASRRIDLSERLGGRETDEQTGMVEPSKRRDRIDSALCKLGPAPVFFGIVVFFAAFVFFSYIFERFLP